MNFELFLGRFHPLVVHLPIGFLFLAVIMEFLAFYFKDKFTGLDKAISIAWLCGGIAALFSAIIGYLLSTGGGYDEQTLFWHKWLGVLLTMLSLFAWAVKSGFIKLPKTTFSILIILVVVTISVTGHLGGNLTHGGDYLLAYAPAPLQKLFGKNMDKGPANLPENSDSVLVFRHIIQPAFAAKCYQCHNESKRKGSLILTSEIGIMEGGENGQALTPGDPHESLLFNRVTLPQNNKKFMPPSGEALSYGELKVMEWWITNGAEFNLKLSDAEIPEEVVKILLRDYGVDASPKAIYDRLTAPKLSVDTIGKIVAAGFKITPLSADHPLFEVGYALEILKEKSIEALLFAKEQITWLDLGAKGVTDESLIVINELKNLTRLNLENNPITDEGIAQLQKLVYLESLNLYGTSITDLSLKTIQKLPALQRVYLWRTDVTQNGVDALQKIRPGLEIQLGYK